MMVISGAMVSDLIGWMGFAVVLALIAPGAASSTGVLTTLGSTVLFAVLMLTVGRWVIHRTFPYIQAYWSHPGGNTGAARAFVMVSCRARQRLTPTSRETHE